MTPHHAWTTALLDPQARIPAHVRAPAGAQAGMRFNIYRNNVVVSLVDALASSFPVVQQLVGEPFFRGMAQAYATQQPPTSAVLAHYGSTFPDFIAAFAPAHSVPYLAAVAQLEWLRLQATHAADATPLAPEAILAALAAQPDDHSVAHLQFRLHPSVGVLRARHAAVSVWRAHQRHEAPHLGHIDLQRAESAWVFRLPNLDTAVVPVSAAAAGWLAHLQAGHSLADAQDAALDIDPDADTTELWLALVRWPVLVGLDWPAAS